MEIKDAIEVIKAIQEQGWMEDVDDAFNVAISAMEKQEAKSPDIETEEIDRLVEGRPAHRKYKLCPVCKENLKIESWTTVRCFGAGTILKSNKNPDYCPVCGQKIDWSEMKE